MSLYSVRGAPRLSANVPWDRLKCPTTLQRINGNGWINGCCRVFIVNTGIVIIAALHSYNTLLDATWVTHCMSIIWWLCWKIWIIPFAGRIGHYTKKMM